MVERTSLREFPFTGCCNTEDTSGEGAFISRSQPTLPLVWLWVRIKNAILIPYLRLKSGRRRNGLWKLPERPEPMLLEALASVVHSAPYAITRHRVRLPVYEMRQSTAAEAEFWHPLADLPHLPMPSLSRRAVVAIISPED